MTCLLTTVLPPVTGHVNTEVEDELLANYRPAPGHGKTEVVKGLLAEYLHESISPVTSHV